MKYPQMKASIHEIHCQVPQYNFQGHYSLQDSFQVDVMSVDEGNSLVAGVVLVWLEMQGRKELVHGNHFATNYTW